MGVTLMAAEIGTALTPLLVIPIQKRFGWRTSFFVLGVIGVLWVTAWRRWYFDRPADSPRISSRELADIGHAAENRGHSLPWGIFLSSANLWAIVLGGFTFRYGFYFFQFWMHTYLVKGRGFTEDALLLTTWIYAGGALTNVVGGWTSDALVNRLGLKWARRAVPFAGLVISAVCLGLTSVVDGTYPIVAMLALSYCGINFAQATSWTVCMDVGTRFSGAVSGARNTAANAGAMISSAAFGYMVGNTASYVHALLPIAGMVALSALFCLRIDASEQVFPAVPQTVAAHSS
jgi:MFS transporter, ACS family, glucarate transporter